MEPPYPFSYPRPAAHAPAASAAFRAPPPTPVQVLEFAAFERCIRHGWWRVLSRVLELLAALAAPSPSPLSEARRAIAAAAPLLDAPLTPAALCDMPDTLDLESFESHWPPSSLNIAAARGPSASAPAAAPASACAAAAHGANVVGAPAAADRNAASPSLPDGSPGSVAGLTRSPPPAGIATVRALRLAWLPRRQLLLRFLAHALGPDTDGGDLAAAEAALRLACQAPPAGIPGGTGGSQPAGLEIPVGEEASWSGLLAAARATCLLVHGGGGGGTGDGPPPSLSEVESSLALWSSLVCSCSGGMQADVVAETGYTPTTQRRLAHLATLEAPLLGLLATRWAEILASPAKPPPHGAPDTAPANASALPFANAPPTPCADIPAASPPEIALHTPAFRAAVAAAIGAASLRVSSALQSLAEALNGKMNTAGGGYTPGPASAARRMAEAGGLIPDEGGASEAAAVRWVKDALRESEGACLAGCREALQAAAARIATPAIKSGGPP